MALTVPKIVFPTGGGTTLTFVYPPRQVPYKTYAAIRHDNLASSGVRESIYERRDEFLNFTMEYVKAGADVSAWDSFMQFALTGAPFDFYVDATINSYATYVLEETSWNAAFKSLGMFSFSMKFRKRVAWP